jgi:dihydrofolate reductase
MILTIIAAVAENGVIGRDGDLPWHLPEDLKRFKRVTSGHTVIMGRKTFETLPSALPNRRNLIVTRQPGYRAKGVEVYASLDDAVAAAGVSAGEDEVVYILGGGEIYRLALPMADRLDLTRIEAQVDGDTMFPDVDWSGWTLESGERHADLAGHSHAFRFERWHRRA